jgi:phospholipid/cholesterol/gamma-HCH transport system permease protein
MADERGLSGALRLSRIGSWVLSILEELGEFALLALQVPGTIARRRFPFREVLQQFSAMVISSTVIVTITALFTGMVLALQALDSLSRFGAKPYTGSFVGLAFVMELGPVLTALMFSGRVGAGIAAEIGSMAVTEQIDAIRAMGANPVQKLVLPRLVAGTLGLPMLTILANVLGIFGGMLIVTQNGISANLYMQSIIRVVQVNDLANGLIKTFFFGWIIAMVGCHMGLRAHGGTVGVGAATTRAVVVGSIAVLVSDFFLTKIILIL